MCGDRRSTRPIHSRRHEQAQIRHFALSPSRPFAVSPTRPPRPLRPLREAFILRVFIVEVGSILFAQILFCFRLGAVCQEMHASAEFKPLAGL
jgi:hypothetical protein